MKRSGSLQKGKSNCNFIICLCITEIQREFGASQLPGSIPTTEIHNQSKRKQRDLPSVLKVIVSSHKKVQFPLGTHPWGILSGFPGYIYISVMKYHNQGNYQKKRVVWGLEFQRDKVSSVSRQEMDTWQQIQGIFYLVLATRRTKNSHYEPKS